MFIRSILRKFSELKGEARLLTPKTFEEYHAQKSEKSRSQKIWEKASNDYSPAIPSERIISLKENFLYDFQKEDFEDSNPLLKKSLSLANATSGQLLSFKKKHAMRKFQDDLMDTGSPVVQIACMTEHLIHLINHVSHHNKDFKTKRKIHELFHRRRTMLNYLMKRDPNYYVWVIKEYNIQESQKVLQSLRLMDKQHKAGNIINKRDYSGSKNITFDSFNKLKNESRVVNRKPPPY
jgi:ribosomal protein S15